MKILHGTWIPAAEDEFIRSGNFYLWVETDTPIKRGSKATKEHPQQLVKADLGKFLQTELGIAPPKYGTVEREIVTKYFILPSTDTEPLPSPELSRYLETEPPGATAWKIWAIDCYNVDLIINTLLIGAEKYCSG